MDDRDFQTALEEILPSLKAEPVQPGGDGDRLFVSLSAEDTDSRWKALLKAALDCARRFELHCWNEETDWISLAARYGTIQESGWSYGKIVAGDVTPDFRAMLLTLEKPLDTEITNKMTPFFNLFLDEIFLSSHYGTEIYLDRNWAHDIPDSLLGGA